MSRPSCPECGRDDVACAVLTASGVSPCAVARWRRLEAERDEARAEAESLRMALAGAEECIEAEQEHQAELRAAIAELLRETAEDQREACARACEVRDNDFARTYADIVRETPLVTTVSRADAAARD